MKRIVKFDLRGAPEAGNCAEPVALGRKINPPAPSRMGIDLTKLLSVGIIFLFSLAEMTGSVLAQEDGEDGDRIVPSISESAFAWLQGPGGMCPVRYDLPAEIPLQLPAGADDGRAQAQMDRYSWSIFLALAAPGVGEHVSRKGDNPTQWDQWSSTVDLIRCNLNPDQEGCVCPDDDCMRSGARYYPPECREIEGFEQYRVLDQFSKVDDSFLESEQGAGGNPFGGLSNSPLVDAKGNFTRYEILPSPVAHDYVVDNQLYNESVLDSLPFTVMFPCGEESYTEGDPADPQVGAFIVKNAWIELSTKLGEGGRDAPQDRDHHGLRFRHAKAEGRGQYHTEDLLVYTPAYRNSTGVASCELKTMALVGQHIMHKTTKQPRWTWSTFEHRHSAPDCTELPPSGDMMGSGPSKACPASVSRSYIFYPEACSADGSDPEACQTCNTPVASNFPGCTNPNVPSDNVSFCLDQPPAEVAGTSKACRQVPVAEYYPTAHQLNRACARRLGKKSVWSNYELISTMWFDEPNGVCRTIQNVPGVRRLLQRPLVPIAGQQPRGPRPFLANSTMETDIRSDCLGCHSAASVTGQPPPPGTDFNFWLQLEVGSEAGRGPSAD
jgi:hypothetical protein